MSQQKAKELWQQWGFASEIEFLERYPNMIWESENYFVGPVVSDELHKAFLEAEKIRQQQEVNNA